METPYKIAWEKFRKSDDFAKLILQMRADNKIETSEHDFFFENRIRIGFDAGWNSREDTLMYVMKNN